MFRYQTKRLFLLSKINQTTKVVLFEPNAGDKALKIKPGVYQLPNLGLTNLMSRLDG